MLHATLTFLCTNTAHNETTRVSLNLYFGCNKTLSDSNVLFPHLNVF